MSKERKDNSFIKKPIYEGGTAALKKFIKTNLAYPDEALQNKIEGSVKIRFEIDKSGKVKKAKIISSLGYGCDEEAKRLVKLLKFKVPKNPRKLKVLFHKNLTIHFNLPKAKKAQQSISYQVIKKEKDQSKNKGGSYGYTISY